VQDSRGFGEGPGEGAAAILLDVAQVLLRQCGCEDAGDERVVVVVGCHFGGGAAAGDEFTEVAGTGGEPLVGLGGGEVVGLAGEDLFGDFAGK
jgi:hypothetical protein